MVTLKPGGGYYCKGKVCENPANAGLSSSEIGEAYKKTAAYRILEAHNTLPKTEKGALLSLKFDALASHDITYVGIIQTAKAIGLQKFPVPYVLTNCHNSLCAVGGTINEDDHMYGLSAAKKYGAVYVPAHQAVIHTFMREMYAGGGKMILGSDSHTRYGALGTMAIGEGGPELVKQIIGNTYDIMYPDVVGVHLTGAPLKGVGPQDVAIALVKATFASGYVKNKVLEFFGDGIENLSVEYRNGIDVMTTETTCLSSVWATDNAVLEYLTKHGRAEDYCEIRPEEGAYYDAVVEIDLSKVEPMIALPFHPSNAVTVRELLKDPYGILGKCEEEGRELLKNPAFTLTDKITADGRIKVDQAIIAGCAGGTYDNIYEAAQILKDKSIGDTLSMSVYCGSQPIYIDLVRKGVIADITESGAIVKTSFCGPCFGAGDVPANNGLSIRHTTRNFPSREGSKPSDKQVASVALMDARSIAATAANGGYLTSALEVDYDNTVPAFQFDNKIYQNRVYRGYKNPNTETELVYGPNITNWPEQIALSDSIIMNVVSVITDPVTTTDELIPSGETSSYRSNPLRLAEFTLSRKDPSYVSRAKTAAAAEAARKQGNAPEEYRFAAKVANLEQDYITGSAIFAMKPGDGSAREQAASCQRVLGGIANLAKEYATKRYRSNLINWGMVPFLYDFSVPLQTDDLIAVKSVFVALESGETEGIIIRNGKKVAAITLKVDPLTSEERAIIKAGCLINYQRKK
ncbi:MAG: hydratase [Clostridia bacterium]|nr:hydratase [Clostridia bacterium]